jgi:hypothetical protein
MSTKVDESIQNRTFETVARKQFDAFEREDHQIRMEERKERALRLPIALQVNLIRDSSG